MEKEQEEYGIEVYEYDNIHYVKTNSDEQKNITNLILYNVIGNIYTDFGHKKDWELFIDIYSKLTGKIRRDNDRTLTF